MERLGTWTLELAIIDWIAIGLLIVGFFAGLQRGLGSSFAFLLWIVAALWLGAALADPVLGWMPNSVDAQDAGAQFTSYGAIAGAVLLLAVLAKVLGGALGKKKEDKEASNKQMGALVGLVNAVLVLTLSAPYLRRFEFVAESFARGIAPKAALVVADNLPFLYPQTFRDELHAASAAAADDAAKPHLKSEVAPDGG